MPFFTIGVGPTPPPGPALSIAAHSGDPADGIDMTWTNTSTTAMIAIERYSAPRWDEQVRIAAGLTSYWYTGTDAGAGDEFRLRYVEGLRAGPAGASTTNT